MYTLQTYRCFFTVADAEPLLTLLAAHDITFRFFISHSQLYTQWK